MENLGYTLSQEQLGRQGHIFPDDIFDINADNSNYRLDIYIYICHFHTETQETALRVSYAAVKKPKHNNTAQSAVIWVLGGKFTSRKQTFQIFK